MLLDLTSILIKMRVLVTSIYSRRFIRFWYLNIAQYIIYIYELIPMASTLLSLGTGLLHYVSRL
jgi:hypothetical protein